MTLIAAALLAAVVGALVRTAAQPNEDKQDSESGQRWREHRTMGTALGVVAHLLPVAAGVAVSLMLVRHIGHPSRIGAIAAWSALAVLSTIVMLLVDRVARRLLP